MKARAVTVGELDVQTGIDTVILVSILFGLEEMRAVEWMRLSEALDISPDDPRRCHRLVSAGNGVCRWVHAPHSLLEEPQSLAL